MKNIRRKNPHNYTSQYLDDNAYKLGYKLGLTHLKEKQWGPRNFDINKNELNIVDYKILLNQFLSKYEYVWPNIKYINELTNYKNFEIGYLAAGIDNFNEKHDPETVNVLTNIIIQIQKSSVYKNLVLEDCIKLLWIIYFSRTRMESFKQLSNGIGFGIYYTAFLIKILLKLDYIDQKLLKLWTYKLTSKSENLLKQLLEKYPTMINKYKFEFRTDQYYWISDIRNYLTENNK